MISIPIIHVGGPCDSYNPRKVHILGDNETPLCGQYFIYIERQEQSNTSLDPSEDIGEWCEKCRKIYLKHQKLKEKEFSVQ